MTDLAQSLIRGPLVARLTDRSFILPVIFSVFVCLAAYNEKIAWELAVTLIGLVVGIFTSSEKNKDAQIGAAAVAHEAQD